jgi:hypothetical protein
LDQERSEEFLEIPLRKRGPQRSWAGPDLLAKAKGGQGQRATINAWQINTKKLSSLQRKLMTKNDTSKTANMKWDGSV